MKIYLDFKPYKCKRCGWTIGTYKNGYLLGELSLIAIKKYYFKLYKKLKPERKK